MKKLIEKIKENKILSSVMVLIIGALVILVFRATYAYFVGQITETPGDITVKTGTPSKFEFNVGDSLTINATSTTLPENGSNLETTTTASALLLANSVDNHSTMNYYVYFKVLENNFVYSDGSTPEIILSITDPNGNEVTKLEGLTYGTFSGVSGFDVTTATGLFEVANNYEIVSNSSKVATTQNWQFKLTYLNLDIDQTVNYGHMMDTHIVMSKNETVLALNEICLNQTLNDCIKAQYTGAQGDNNLYLHDTTLENGAGDNSYRYAGSSKMTNNFVCFGYDSTDGSCPIDNLYRIIGLFGDNVKLVKYDYANSNLLGTDGNYSEETYSKSVYPTYKGYFDVVNRYTFNPGTKTNSWNESDLITKNLNQNYVANLGDKWSSKIISAVWTVGGGVFSEVENTDVKNVYNNEILNPRKDTVYNDEIGLLYISDYGYASSPSAWTTKLYDASGTDYSLTEISSNNWLYMGLREWLMTPRYDYENMDFTIHLNGAIHCNVVEDAYNVRPVFYLNSDIMFVNGLGTMDKPIIIK